MDLNTKIHYANKYKIHQQIKHIVDNFSKREKWFEVCLQKLADFTKENQLQKIAFPYKIGCDITGGKWENYKKMIQEFSEKNTGLKIYIVQQQE
ncbi:tetratricopeptide repeat protein (macronuclear) [Tetrahymena thermophila SB210]|uniref:Tetratricopeptide repeat protein n=1 Tax=Tetrahymena thermophila (strain SB210) TaxID=312017 RepID=W7X475_TETTS|nr:tetratricopeptide repeat protein [Tetrahymena thermophila SB210]EWS72237.1 tetratricopeptide repeat protein [Tetrahymena thermophila SB210]|eukprot:XP_012655177.1 tetratricopeptide repeat protein [Tetrahymena thermophila SB210]